MGNWAGTVSDVVSHGGPVWALVGTLFGSFITTVSARMLASDRQRYEDRTRFHDKKSELYADHFDAVLDLTSSITKFPYGKKSNDEKERERLEARIAAAKRFTRLTSRLYLLGGEQVRASAKELANAHSELRETLEGSSDVSTAENAWEAFFGKSSDLHAAMRTELGSED